MFGIEAGDADVLTALIAAFATVLVAIIGVQWKVHRDNRSDHGETAAKVDRLLENQDEFRRDVTYVRADLTTIRGELTELRSDVADLRSADSRSNARISKLEHNQEDQA